MQCTSPIRLYKGVNSLVYPDGLVVPCGKCLSCRIAKRREWTMRLWHELPYHQSSIFLTLTYDDDNLPPNASLSKSDLQKFFKRLRKDLSYVDRKIKYFAAGEYGPKTNRPHYHAIVFGLSLQGDDKNWLLKLGHFAIGIIAGFLLALWCC